MSSLVKTYKTASSRIETDKYYQYMQKLAEKGTVPNEDLKKHIEEVLKGNEREEGPPTGDSELNRHPLEESGNEKPKRTITFNGKTYEI